MLDPRPRKDPCQLHCLCCWPTGSASTVVDLSSHERSLTEREERLCVGDRGLGCHARRDVEADSNPWHRQTVKVGCECGWPDGKDRYCFGEWHWSALGRRALGEVHLKRKKKRANDETCVSSKNRSTVNKEGNGSFCISRQIRDCRSRPVWYAALKCPGVFVYLETRT